MDKIKESFQNVKDDMDFFYDELYQLKKELVGNKEDLAEICSILSEINKKLDKSLINHTSTHNQTNTTDSTYSSTYNHPLGLLKSQNKPFSNGNEGVPTDKQTNRQTDSQQENITKIEQVNTQNNPYSTEALSPKFQIVNLGIQESQTHISSTPIDDVAKILDSLDGLKKEIRLKFKRLTEQELAVFSTLYQIDEETGPTDYKTIASRLKLTESSIRDYVGRLIKKGIPVDKKKMNNKLILLSISENLKKVASLPTILELRDL
ncbi:MAG: hypothetical protein KKB79_01265 [Nanoarchaeota archaeon]|nr:hypothetical protein [Nanoarchaeota archaeon]